MNVPAALRVIQTAQETMRLIDVDQSRISMLSQEIQAQQILIDKLKNEGQILKSSQQYLDASQTLAEIKRIEEEKEKLKKETSNMFSNISRAITKYSYGHFKDHLFKA